MAAHNEAHATGHATIAPAHLVLGLLADPESLAAAAITAQGVALSAVRDAAIASLPPASDAVPELIPYDDAAQTTLKTTFAVAQRLGHPSIGTEHILLALLERRARRRRPRRGRHPEGAGRGPGRGGSGR